MVIDLFPRELGEEDAVTEASAPGAGPTDSRAAAFRRKRAERGTAWKDRIQVIVMAGVLAIGVFVVVTARTGSPVAGNDFLPPPPPPPGPTIVVNFGTPSQSNLTCGDGGGAFAEHIPWLNSTQPVTVEDIAVHVVELGDGDYVPDPNSAPNVTTSNLCAGPTPNPSTRWYAVLSGPTGTNLFTFTEGQAWVPVAQEPVTAQIENGSSLVVITNPDLAGKGFGLHVLGFAGNDPIAGSVPL